MKKKGSKKGHGYGTAGSRAAGHRGQKTADAAGATGSGKRPGGKSKKKKGGY